MNAPTQIAKHFREVIFGGNWCTVNLKDTLQDITWEQANTQVSTFNTITALTYHIGYYVTAVLKVLEGGSLDAHDKFSFDHPVVTSEADWQQFQGKIWTEAEKFATLIEKLPEEIIYQDFIDGKYDIYFRNLVGIIEHTHYHLGQIALLKKMILST
ncbi:DUF1572 domain-containing protein [Flavobacterium sp. AG291]|uniref:DUF1572 domain-containing protein n=1 Tax=Flavobacterium sp. AG291 TaxID=2184000 RepID=UPI000E0C3D75|nr:DUF1572 domain-containing protein [Flavobacterium sp. AG291]RDI13197.1 hypothetical protein DEU42_103107 [Flavobacterium sp. AG291]